MASALGKERKVFVDVAKGLTILLVVIEHNPFIYKYHGTVQAIILSFHMPLFYFVSGLFFSCRDKLRILASKRAQSLLKPYFFSCLLFLSLKLLKYRNLTVIEDAIPGILYGTSTSLAWPYQPLWFLTSLFVTLMACRLLYSVLSRVKRAAWRLVVLFFCLVCGVLVLHQSRHFPYGGLPWNIDLIGITIFFYAIGFECRRSLFKLQNVPLFQAFFVLIFFVGLHWYFTVLNSDPDTINLTLRHYDSLVVNTLEALCGILLVIYLSIGVVQYSSVLTGIFSFIGIRSLTVFIFHDFFMPYLGDLGNQFWNQNGFYLFVFSVVLTIFFTLLTHETFKRIPWLGFLLLNQGVRPTK